MFLTIFIIIGSSVWRGLLNYLILNGILSTLLIISLLLNNYVLFIFLMLGKIGYFPFFLILGYQYCSSSYLWIFFDLINKWAYFGSIIFSICFGSLLSLTFSDCYVFINFLMIGFLIRFILSMKHFILISSLQLFLFILSGLYFEDELLCFVYLLCYFTTTIYIIWDCQGYTRGAYYDLCYFTLNLILSGSQCNALNLKHNLPHNALFSSFSLSFFSCNIFSIYYLFPYFFTDLTSIKELVKINSILYILYLYYCFSFFPTIMFLLKLFILFSFISTSLYYALVLIVYIIFSLQSFYLRSLGIVWKICAAFLF